MKTLIRIHCFAVVLVAFGITPTLGDFDCRSVKAGDKTFNLSSLDREYLIKREYETPPTRSVTVYTISLCKAISHKSDVADSDQCPLGTRICAVTTNKKEGENDRIITVIPVAGDIGDRSLNPDPSLLDGNLKLKLEGGVYVDKAQKAQIKFKCSSDLESEPVFDDQDDDDLKLEWETKYACANENKNGDGEKDKEPSKTPESPPSNNSGIGIGGFGLFVILVFLSIAAYLIFGSIINYNRYGSTTFRDLLPHSDFWADIPYLIKDMFSRFVGSIRGDRRGGYAAL